MEEVKLRAVSHGGSEYIAITLGKESLLAPVISQCPDCRWSRSLGCWLLPLHHSNYSQLRKTLKGKAGINEKELKEYLVERKSRQAFRPVSEPVPGKARIEVLLPRPPQEQPIHPVNGHVIQKMREELDLRAYSKSTIKTYLNEMNMLIQLLGPRPVDSLTEDDIRRYLVYCVNQLKLSENTLHSRINALKFYFEKVLQRDRFFWQIPRPKKQMQLPRLLNEDELAALFNALPNKKHKAMLFTAYSAGLRLSEIVSLKLTDIDSSRMQIFLQKAKGKKDRYVNLSPVLLDILRKYVSSYKPRPKFYLFESEQTGAAYAARTVQQIFTNAKNRAGIRKKLGIHSLRHSFATHLLDRGTDIRYIKDILGHFNIRTTERYLHVSKSQLVNIESPFDNLFRSRSIDW